jgi:hypothetical protein
MALTFRAAQGSNNAGGGTSITMTVPTGVQDNDVMLMQITGVGGTGTTITTPGGWTLISRTDDGTVIAQAIYWRLAASEPASYAVTITSNKASGTIIAFSGANTAGPEVGTLSTGQVVSGTVWGRNLSNGTFASSTVASIVWGGGAIGTTWASDGSFAGTSPPSAQSASTGGSTGSRTTSIVEYRIDAAQTATKNGLFNVNAAALSRGHLIGLLEATVAAQASARVINVVGQAVNRASTY